MKPIKFIIKIFRKLFLRKSDINKTINDLSEFLQNPKLLQISKILYNSLNSNFIKNDEYRCSICKNIYKKEWSDKEAMQECIDNFGELAILDDCDIICDDCYNKINPKKYPGELKKVKKEFYKNRQ